MADETSAARADPETDPLHDYTRLEPSAFLLAARDAATSDSTGVQPALIVLCTWVNAAPRHIAKYTTVYSELYPKAAQLVLRTSLADMTSRSDSRQRAMLAKTFQTISDLPSHRVLLHIFSHGGAHKACQLALLWRGRTGSPLPVSAIILDSTPGLGTYKRSLDAILLSIPRSPFIRAVAIPLTHTYLAASWTISVVFRFENVVQRLRAGLNDTNLFPLQASRLYVYSKADKMVWWQDIEAHATTAETLGWEVKRVRFEKSPHAAHILEDAEKYWDAVKSLWSGVANM
ncbi:DUF829-domain-containing protein [Lojkania enalia]|uniref:DUF829-domain-containing protein n=1 Tax=Lojkania enalia TaxID=147567 RepID=A0A9P4KE24_9PLEO|nr:DUF829-domain-containing protein [Didymosphaeria enalia]